MRVLILTARDCWSGKVQGIDAGADDYVAKPLYQHLYQQVALVRLGVGADTRIVNNIAQRDRPSTIDLVGRAGCDADQGYSSLEKRLPLHLHPMKGAE